MFNVQKAFTAEVDDVAVAVSEIQEQLDLDALASHSVGIIGALPAFIESGVVAALQEVLPFDLFGQTSIATSARGSEELDQLVLLVLSSDEVAFSAALSEPITGESTEPVEAAYAQAAASHAEKPGLILINAPLLQTASGDFFIRGLNTASGGVPVFGGIAVDDTIDYHNSQVIYQGKSYNDRMVCLLLFGNVHPRFYLATITYGKVFDASGVVTSSSGSLLKTINGAPVSEFLKGVGIQPNSEGEFVAINTFPYLVDYNDGSDPGIRVMFAVTPEGYAACGGDIPEGATLTVSFFDADEILQSSKVGVERLAADIASQGACAVLAYSCVGRYFSLGYDEDAEVRLLRDALSSNEVPYTFTYCGGEFCPVGSKEHRDASINRAHNSTFIALIL